MVAASAGEVLGRRIERGAWKLSSNTQRLMVWCTHCLNYVSVSEVHATGLVPRGAAPPECDVLAWCRLEGWAGGCWKSSVLETEAGRELSKSDVLAVGLVALCRELREPRTFVEGVGPLYEAGAQQARDDVLHRLNALLLEYGDG